MEILEEVREKEVKEAPSLGHDYFKSIGDLVDIRRISVPYGVTKTERVAMAMGISERQIAKTILFESRGRRLYAAVVPATSDVDIVKLEFAIKYSLIQEVDEAGHDSLIHYSKQSPSSAKLHLRKARRSSIPKPMTPGTIGPFPQRDHVLRDYRGRIAQGSLGRIIVDSGIDPHVPMDFAVPGAYGWHFLASMDNVIRTVDDYVAGVMEDITKPIIETRLREAVGSKPRLFAYGSIAQD